MSSGFRDGQEEEVYFDMEGDREFAGRQENREAPFHTEGESFAGSRSEDKVG